MCSLRRRRSGRRRARSSRATLAPTLARAPVRCEAARVQSQAAALWPSPCSLVAVSAGSHAGAHLYKVRGGTCAAAGGGALAVAVLARRGLRWLLRGAHFCKVRGCACAVSGGGALAVALLACRGLGLRWLLRWRAPLKVRGCKCAVSGGGALAVAVLARRGLRWLLGARPIKSPL